MPERLEAIHKRMIECQRELAKVREELARIEGEAEGLRRAEVLLASSGVKGEPSVREIKLRLVENHQRLVAARHAVSRIEGELNGLAIAWEIAGGDRPLPDLSESQILRGRDISPAWRMILGYFLKRLPAPASIGDVMGFIADNDLRISRNAVRSQLHLYANRGFLKRVGDGLYKATDAVKRIC
jgi:hypothetical protein